MADSNARRAPGRPIDPQGWTRDLVFLRATRNRLAKLADDPAIDTDDLDRIERAIIRADKLMTTIERFAAKHQG